MNASKTLEFGVRPDAEAKNGNCLAWHRERRLSASQAPKLCQDEQKLAYI